MYACALCVHTWDLKGRITARFYIFRFSGLSKPIIWIVIEGLGWLYDGFSLIQGVIWNFVIFVEQKAVRIDEFLIFTYISTTSSIPTIHMCRISNPLIAFSQHICPKAKRTTNSYANSKIKSQWTALRQKRSKNLIQIDGHPIKMRTSTHSSASISHMHVLLKLLTYNLYISFSSSFKTFYFIYSYKY